MTMQYHKDQGGEDLRQNRGSGRAHQMEHGIVHLPRYWCDLKRLDQIHRR